MNIIREKDLGRIEELILWELIFEERNI